MEAIKKRPGRPPAAALPHLAVETAGATVDETGATPSHLQIIGRKAVSVQFEGGGVQFLSKVKSGLNAIKDNCEIVVLDVCCTVLIKMDGREWIVPGSKVNCVVMGLA